MLRSRDGAHGTAGSGAAARRRPHGLGTHRAGKTCSIALYRADIIRARVVEDTTTLSHVTSASRRAQLIFRSTNCPHRLTQSTCISTQDRSTAHGKMHESGLNHGARGTRGGGGAGGKERRCHGRSRRPPRAHSHDHPILPGAADQRQKGGRAPDQAALAAPQKSRQPPLPPRRPRAARLEFKRCQ